MIEFPGKQSNETVMAVFRKHPIILIRNVAIFCLASILPLLIFLTFWSSRFPLMQSGNVGLFGYLGASIYFLYSLVFLAISLLDDEFDLFILTDRRLIDITQKSLLQQTVAIARLDQIQDAASNVNGILGTLFNYGNVDVQTAGGNVNHFMIDSVSDPAMVSRTILNQSEIFKESLEDGKGFQSDQETVPEVL